MAIPFLLIALFAHSSAESGFPWKSSKPLPWQLVKCRASEIPCFIPNTHSCNMPLTVHLSANGTVKITRRDGLVCLRLSLPGRPQKVWRDCGTRVADILAPMSFSVHSPLQRNFNDILLDILDFRSNLEGLLWILDDSESILTIINPSTSQAVYLKLPDGQDLSLAFHPDRIEVFEDHPKTQNKAQASWSLYWLTLIQNFIQLGKYSDQHQKRGKVLAPFGKLQGHIRSQ